VKREQPQQRVMIVLSFLLICLGFGLTIYVIEKGLVKDESLGIILSVWLTGGVVSVIGFWFGTSLGGRITTEASDKQADTLQTAVDKIPPVTTEGEG
jgi:hypothetical protein